MQRIYTLAIALLSILPTQAQNAFDFDGVNDYANVPDASSFFNSDSIAMSFWVYPTTQVSGFPNLEGFLGFRNDNNADFYVLQLDTFTLECRFRNDQGSDFDINWSGLKLNEWQHIVFSYDTDSLRLYHNGVKVAAEFASGKMFKPNQTLHIGYLPYGNQPFFLDGMLDEISLYEHGLDDSTVSCIYNSGVPMNHPKLRLYYPFSQGVAGGVNTDEDSIYTFFSHFDAQIFNAALSGSSSNWVSGIDDPYPSTVVKICSGDTIKFHGKNLTQEGVFKEEFSAVNGCDSFDLIRILRTQPQTSQSSGTICEGDTFTFDGNHFTETGYFDVWYKDKNGCDSIHFVDLTVNSVGHVTIIDTACEGDIYNFLGTQILGEGVFFDTSKTNNNCDSITRLELARTTLDTGITVMSNILTANELFADSYQWLDCSNGLPITGETGRSIVVSTTGEYRVLVVKGGCNELTRCIEVEVVNSVGEAGREMSVYPNPTSGVVNIDLSGQQVDEIRVYDVLGQLVLHQIVEGEVQSIDLSEMVDGQYIVRVIGKTTQEFSVSKQSDF